MTAPAHIPRISRADYDDLAPAAVAALRALGKAVDDSGLEKTLTELIKIRASQINGCAFCIQFHLNMARKLGVEAAKLDLLAAWRETGVYSERERAALAWTEAVTQVSTQEVSDELYTLAREHFDEKGLVDLTLAVIAINGWNRLNVAFRTPVGDYVSPYGK